MTEEHTEGVEDGGETLGEGYLIDSVLDYLESREGHEVVTGLITTVKDAKDRQVEFNAKAAVIKARKFLIFNIVRTILILVSIGSVYSLLLNDKFDSAAALFFGSIVAYLFGKEPAG